MTRDPDGAPQRTPSAEGDAGTVAMSRADRLDRELRRMALLHRRDLRRRGRRRRPQP